MLAGTLFFTSIVSAQVEVTSFVKYKSYLIPVTNLVNPITPSGFSADITAAYTITVSWHSHVAAEEFTVTWKQPGETQFEELYKGSGTQVILPNRELGQYQFRIVACGSTICAPISGIASVTVAHPNDQDQDGVLDQVDECSDTQWGHYVNEDGCSDAQIDSDNDGVSDALDLCNGTPGGSTVSARGCFPTNVDSDSDGVTDDLDVCAGTASEANVNQDGCSSDQGDPDLDGDGIPNSEDSYPLQHAYQCPGY